MISFVSKGFPYKDPIGEVFTVMVSFCVLPTRNIVNLLVYFTSVTTTLLFKGTIFVLRQPLNPNQSVQKNFVTFFGKYPPNFVCPRIIR